MRLEGKVALITGAATGVEGEMMGFGGATARLFAREGANLVLSDVNEELGQATAEQVREGGGEAFFLRLDVTKEQDWTRAIETALSLYGGLDILVNSAGNTVRTVVEETTVEIWDQQMNVHAKGAFLGAKHAIPAMRKSGGGSIVNVGSIAGLVGTGSSTAYHGAKGALRMFTRAAAVQYASEGIRVNAVHPGFALTPMTQDVFKGKVLAERLSSVPMGRLATAEEIAYGILYFASDESSFVTGADLVIDGGMTAM